MCFLFNFRKALMHTWQNVQETTINSPRAKNVKADISAPRGLFLKRTRYRTIRELKI